MDAGRVRRWALPGLLIAGLGVALAASFAPVRPSPASGGAGETYTVTSRDFVHTLRMSGTVEAVETTTVAAPRLSGPNTSSLVISRLVRGGTRVQAGDLLVEFDRQTQVTAALDRRAELNDLEQQIRRRTAEEAAARARDDSELRQAQSAVSRADLEIAKNEMLPRIQAEKNTQALEQAKARLAQLEKTFDLKRKAAAADLRILEIRRGKAENAMQMAETNASRMEVRSPISGLAVIRTRWKTNGMAEILEGEEIRAGVPVVDIVNPARMRVRVRVNQADINDLRTGQPIRIGLDAYPDLSFTGRVAQISPLAVTSTLSPKVRYFVMLADVDGAHERLMPDLTASLDVELARIPNALVLPRDAVELEEGRAMVRVRQGRGVTPTPVTVRASSATEVVVADGLRNGDIVERKVALARAER